MTRALKTTGAGLVMVLLAALVPGTSHPAPPELAPPLSVLSVPPALQHAIEDAVRAGEPYLEMDVQVASPADMGKLEQAVAAAGGQVVSSERTYARVKVPPAVADTLPHSAPIVAVGVNQNLTLDQPTVATADAPVNPADASRLAAISLDPMGVTEFREQRKVNGDGVLVAVIDSGVDPGHPDLLRTPAGKPKIVDWKDFTVEGNVETTHVVQWAATYTEPNGRRYGLPARPDASRSARFGYWDELTLGGYYLNRDLDRNGQQTDRFGVLLVDAAETGRYDTVYVDTNNDGNFADEQPLKVYKESHSVAHMGATPQPSRQINFVVADIAADAKSVSLGFDGHGHGTHVAGVLGASNPAGFTGVAPGVQIMALKAQDSGGNGSWFTMKQAIRYAAQNGANIINISVGNLASAASQFDTGASEFLNQIARDYGVLIVMAADNTGPGLSSGETLGNPSEVMAIGAYYSPAMWKRDFGWVVPHETIWSQSGMGPRSDGSYVPSVVAPGGSPATSPYWIHNTGYTTAVGTSIATPHVAGVAALLMEAGKAAGTNFDRMSVKRALELGARPIPGFQVYEQGHGLVSPTVAFSHLKQINSVPSLMARTGEGDGGLLARSYRPGSTSFWLTNLDTELTRVGIYTGESWVTPAFSSLTLPPGVQRQLPLRLDPPQTPGVHSAFVMVTHPNKYGPSLTVPITYVRPIDLTGAPENKYAASHELEVGRYQRFFFDVKPGTGALNVTTRVQLNQENQVRGTVQVHVFRPDGQAVHTAKIGADGQGLTALLSAESPMEGSWEVVVTAFPDARGANLTAAYTLEVQTQPGMFANLPVKLSVPAGSTTTYPLKVLNTGAAFAGHVEAIGLSRLEAGNRWNLGQPWKVQKGTQSPDDFTLGPSTSLMRVEISNPVPTDAELTLELWYLDGNEWRPRGKAIKKGPGQQSIELSNLPAGRYQVVVTPNGSAPANLQYQYRRLMGVEGYHLQVADPVRQHDRNDTWTPTLTVAAPKTPGRYIGQLVVRDTESNALSWYPFEVSVGEPELLVEPLVSQLIRNKPSTVVLELRNAATGSLTDGTVTVSGARYLSRNGQVQVPVAPTDSTQVLDVAIDKPGYQFVHKQIRLPVGDAWRAHPLGIDLNQEFANWRRKVMSQLP